MTGIEVKALSEEAFQELLKATTDFGEQLKLVFMREGLDDIVINRTVL